MRQIAILIMVAAVCLAGCGEKQQVPPSTAVSAPETPANWEDVNRALRKFYAQEGAEPARIEELVFKGYLTVLPPVPPGKKVVIVYDNAIQAPVATLVNQ